jgi:ubiquinone/menaquinone biosynthesis C-methylase UbiE
MHYEEDTEVLDKKDSYDDGDEHISKPKTRKEMEQLDRTGKVKGFFEEPKIYLTYDYNLRLRMETIKSMIRGREIKTVLDAPCGTGDISVPLLDKFENLTLVDFSENMLKLAAGKVPQSRMEDVRFIKGDINAWKEKETYDLVMCLGAMAHMEDPEKFLIEMSQRVSRGGYLIIQNTDSHHPYSFLIRAYRFFRGLAGKNKYSFRWTSQRRINSLMKTYGFMSRKKWRYNQSWLGFSHLFSNKKKYAATRAWFGKLNAPKLQMLGSDVIAMYKRL